MKMTNLELALPRANQAWKLFACRWDAEKKTFRPAGPWGKESTDDPEKIKALAKENPDCFFCVNTQASNITILDVDNKNGKKGDETLLDLSLEHDIPTNTLEVETPSGGRHLYYIGAVKNSVEKIGPGLDTPVMAPIPGSNVPGKGVYKIINSRPMVVVPDFIREKAGEIRERPENNQKPLCELDLPSNIALAIEYLKEAEPAIEGAGGDSHTYNVICGVKDLGVSKETCLELVLEYYNDRCMPSWRPEEAKIKVDNAYQYSRNRPGSSTPQADFTPIPGFETAGKENKPASVRALKSGIEFRSFHDMRSRVKKPEYVVDGLIEKHIINLYYGDSGSLKSFLAMDIGLHIAAGMDWAGRKVDQGAVFYLAGEGYGGNPRRLEAWAIHNKIPKDAEYPFFVSSTSVQFDNRESVEELVKLIQRMGKVHGPPKLVIVDTIATSFGSGDENSTKDMVRYLNYINLGVRHALNTTVLLIHHTGHSEKERPRGAYALMAGVDSHALIERGTADNMMVCLHRPGKLKDGEPWDDMWFRAEVIEIVLDQELESITSLALTPKIGYSPPITARLGTNQRAVMDLMGDRGSMPIEEMQDRFREWKADKGEDFIRQNFHRALDRLEELNQIARVNGNIILVQGGLPPGFENCH